MGRLLEDHRRNVLRVQLIDLHDGTILHHHLDVVLDRLERSQAIEGEVDVHLQLSSQIDVNTPGPLGVCHDLLHPNIETLYKVEPNKQLEDSDVPTHLLQTFSLKLAQRLQAQQVLLLRELQIVEVHGLEDYLEGLVRRST